MRMIKQCLLIEGGVIAILPENADIEGEEFDFEVVDGKLCYKSINTSLEIDEEIIAHLMEQEQAKVYFFGSWNPMTLRFKGAIDVSAAAATYARGALWALRHASVPSSSSKEEQVDATPGEEGKEEVKNMSEEVPALFEGLKLPPGHKLAADPAGSG